MRRFVEFLWGGSDRWVACAVCLLGVWVGTVEAVPPYAAQGVLVGEVTDRAASVQVRLTATDSLAEGDVPGLSGEVEFELMEQASGNSVGSVRQRAAAEQDFIARVRFRYLKPGTSYQCRTRLHAGGQVKSGPVATFQTHSPSTAADVSMVVVTGMNYAKFHGDARIDRAVHKIKNNTALPQPYDGPDKHLGYPALAAIRALEPDFFIGTGDNVYYDTPQEPRARTRDEMRQKWHEQFVQPRYRELFAAVATYWMMDDHDFRIDDADNSGDYAPLPRLGEEVFREQLPMSDQPGGPTYRTYRLTPDLQIWLPENRLHRSHNRQPDGPEKSIWGVTQREWLMRTLRDSDATYKLIVSPTPMVGPDDKRKTDNHTNIGGFQHERDAFFAYLRRSAMDNVFLVCGDRHWQYHAEHPAGVQEFSCGALVDANSRLGRKPGDPASTDPAATIKQHYTQQEPSGGFLEIRLTHQPQVKLTFVWRDERGEVLHKHEKVAD